MCQFMLAVGAHVSSYWDSSSRNDTVEISDDADVLCGSLELQKTHAGNWVEGAAPAQQYCEPSIMAVLSCSHVMVKDGGGGGCQKP